MSQCGCSLVELPKVRDHRGNLTFLEGGRHVRRIELIDHPPA